MDNSSFEHEPKVRLWKKSVQEAGCSIEKLEPLSLRHKKNGDLLFALLDGKIRSPEGYYLPNIIFLRGDACLIVALARNRETREERFLMVRQRRVGSGGALSLEFPAGMLDADVDDPRGVAVREFCEETGVEIAESDLFPLCNKKLYSSVGASDEAIFYFGCFKEFDDASYRSLMGRLTGQDDEHISVVLMSKSEAETESSSLQVKLGFHLFEQYRQKNRLLSE
jgi:8-oxo-dGTP pyrophosphatase MutT (NUDIX family)